MLKHRSSIPPMRVVWLTLPALCFLGAASQPPPKPIAPGSQRERVSLVLIDVVATDRQGPRSKRGFQAALKTSRRAGHAGLGTRPVNHFTICSVRGSDPAYPKGLT